MCEMAGGGGGGQEEQHRNSMICISRCYSFWKIFFVPKITL